LLTTEPANWEDQLHEQKVQDTARQNFERGQRHAAVNLMALSETYEAPQNHSSFI